MIMAVSLSIAFSIAVDFFVLECKFRPKIRFCQVFFQKNAVFFQKTLAFSKKYLFLQRFLSLRPLQGGCFLTAVQSKRFHKFWFLVLENPGVGRGFLVMPLLPLIDPLLPTSPRWDDMSGATANCQLQTVN
jgi:hypothetical protein